MPTSRIFIPMADGVRLAATLYLPDTDGPWPAVLEAYPYRKDDLSMWEDDYLRLRDEGDYAVCRVDVRGTGSSEGVATAEYPPVEAQDLGEVIAWLAAQDWCTGAVGMYGTSYGGFATIHAAMRRPPALKAIVPIFATDDRYTDDIHFAGGVRKAIEFGYPLFMVPMNALPPVPALAGEGWREQWLQRIETLEPWFGSIEHQADGPFWRQGSLRPDYHLIEAPTMLVAGWADLYRTAMLRMAEHLTAPTRLVMGPWSHMGTADAVPGPRIDLVPELIRWFDRHLRGIENGIDTEPHAIFVRHASRPEPDLEEARGSWRHEPVWPPARRRAVAFGLATAERPGGTPGRKTLAVRGDVGTTAHIRGTYYPPYGLALDQRPDEAFSLVYDWIVTEDTEILGSPTVVATVRSSAPVAQLAAKLCEVLDDGTSVLISRGLLNLTHRASHTAPEPLVPGQAYDVQVELDATSWVLADGARLRLSLAGADWPDGWPPPEASELTVEPTGSRLVLPVVSGTPPVATVPQLVPVPGEIGRPAPEKARWVIERDVYARETRVVVTMRTVTDLGDGSQAVYADRVCAGVDPERPGHAYVDSMAETEVVWPEVTARTRGHLVLRSDETTYRFELTLEVWEDGRELASRRWEFETPRQLQ